MSTPIGPFRILEITATGNYGAVAVALPADDPDGEPRALKVLRMQASKDPKMVQRTRDEARMLYRLAHPNIVRVERLIEVLGRPVVVMEWVRGVSLRQLMERWGAIPLATAIEIARQTALALDAAWSSADEHGRPLRIIHRDIKPSNILLDVHGCVKVVDFGVARGNFDDREAQTQLTLLGTAGYIAPERRQGRVHETQAVDVYGLGVTLFELLAGRSLILPLEVAHHDEALGAQLAEAAAGLGDATPGERCLREALGLVAVMCAADPDARPDVGDVVVALWKLGRTLEVESDLAAFARTHVEPLWTARPRTPPAEHPDHADLQFLEQDWEHATEAGGDAVHVPHTVITQRETANRRVRRFLLEEGWYDHTRQLSWLLATNPDWSAEPFVEKLEVLARVPWWAFWRRAETERQVGQCLRMLRYRRTREVLDLARRYVDHRNPAVSGAARDLLGLTPVIPHVG